MTRRILFVDDEARVLSGFQRLLRRRYEFDTSSDGEAALALMDQHRYAVVVSDMRMPKMSGEEFLGHAHDRQPEAVQIIVSGQANLDATVAAVNRGNIFRFLVKPVQGDVLTDTLDRALKQYALVEAERVLLEQTLSGAVEAMAEVVRLVSPSAARHSQLVTRVIDRIAPDVGLEGDWQLRLAGLLSGVGYAAVPGDILDRAFAGHDLDDHELAMLDTHPEITSELLGRIPRMEGVAGLILAGNGAAAAPDGLGHQLQLYQLAHEVATGLLRGHSFSRVVEQAEASQRFAPELVAALRTSGLGDRSAVRERMLNQIVAGMVFRRDVTARNGMLLAAAGTLVTPSLLQRLRNFARTNGVAEPLVVE